MLRLNAGPRAWLEGIAGDRASRARIAARTLSGAIGDLEFAALIRKIDKTDTSWRH